MRYFEFYLTKPSKGGTVSRELRNGNLVPVAYPPSYTIPSIARVTDTREDSKTKGRPITIRYYEGEPSIWSDMQGDEFTMAKYKQGEVRTTPITFYDGKLRVPESNETLLDFLRAHRINSDNSSKYGHTGRGFYEHRPQRMAAQQLETTEMSFNTEAKIRNMKVEKLQNLARITNVITHFNNIYSKEPSEVRWSLIARVRSNNIEDIKNITEYIDDPLLNIKADILFAVDKNDLVWGGVSGESLLVPKTGQIICKVPSGEDRLKYAANFISERSPESHALILTLLGRVKEGEDVVDGKTKQQIAEEIVSFSRYELKGDDKILKSKGPDIEFDGVLLVGNKRGYDGAIEHLTDPNNHEIFQRVYHEYKKRTLTYQ